MNALSPVREHALRRSAQLVGCVGVALLLFCDPGTDQWFSTVLTTGWQRVMIWSGIAFVVVGVGERCTVTCTRCRKIDWTPKLRVFQNGRTEKLCAACAESAGSTDPG